MIMLYADDTIILADTAESLQKGFDCMYSYCNLWKLRINVDKTKVIIFWKSDRFAKPKFMYGDKEIEIVQQYTYLGTIFAYNGNFVKEKKRRVEQASKAMYLLLQKCRKLDLPFDMVQSLFEKLVEPILLYGSEVWGHESLEVIDSLQCKFLRLALRVNRFTNKEMLYCETGCLPIQVKVKTRTINFWARLLSGSKTKLSYKIYQLLKALDVNGIYESPWLKFVKAILNDSGYGYLWLQQEPPDKNLIRSGITTSLLDQARQVLLSRMTTNKKCVNYSLFKHTVDREWYLDSGNDFIIRTWSNFRFGVIAYKMGTMGKCKLCDEPSHDEFHLILQCRKTQDLRLRYLPRYYHDNPNMLKFSSVMNIDNHCFRRKVTHLLNSIQRLTDNQ